MTDQQPTVLVAEDAQAIMQLVSYRLSHSGYRVLEAGDGEEALRIAMTEAPDIAVLDVMMPRLDGYELTRRLRETPETKHIPVILLTARVQEADVARGFEVGAYDYLRKPFNPDELVARVRALLARR